MSHPKQQQYNETWYAKKGYKNYNHYIKDLAKRNGFDSIREYQLHKNWVPQPTDEARLLDPKNQMDPTAIPIPDIPGYYITPMGDIWKQRNSGKWIMLKQQAHKSGYKAFQCYIDGKRYVKYVHRTLCSAFYGERDASYEAHHINADTHDNTLDNLVWMKKEKHRAMPRGPYKKRGL